MVTVKIGADVAPSSLALVADTMEDPPDTNFANVPAWEVLAGTEVKEKDDLGGGTDFFTNIEDVQTLTETTSSGAASDILDLWQGQSLLEKILENSETAGNIEDLQTLTETHPNAAASDILAIGQGQSLLENSETAEVVAELVGELNQQSLSTASDTAATAATVATATSAATNNPLKLADWTKIPDAEKWKTDSAARYPAVCAAGKLAIDMEYDVLMKLLENSDEFRKIFRTIHEKGFIDFIEKKNKAVPNTFSLDEANKRVTQLLAASIDEDITIPLGYTFHINDGKTLSINSGKTLTNDGTIDNHGLVDIAGMQEISNDIITNIKNFGTLINNNVFKSLNKTNNKGKIVNKKDFYITDEDKSDNKKKWRNGELYIKGQPMKDDYINLDNKGIIENKKGTMHVEGMLSNSHNIKNEIGAKFNVGKESTRTTNKEHNTTITGIYSKEKSTFDNFGTFNAGGKDVNSTDTTSDFHPVKMWGDAQAKFYNHSTLAGGGKINKGANMSDFVKIINSVGQENIKNFTNLKDLFAKA